MSFPNPEGGNERPKNRPEVSPDNDSNDTGNGDNALDNAENQDSIELSANLKLAEDIDDSNNSTVESLEVPTSSETDQLSDRVENQQGLKERLSSNKLEIDSSRLALRSSFDFSELLAKQLVTNSDGSFKLSHTLDSSIENEKKHVTGLTDTRVDRAVLLIGSGTDLGIHNGELQLARLVKNNPSLQVTPEFRDKVTDAYLKMAQNRDPDKPAWQSQLKVSDLIPGSKTDRTPLSSSQIIEGIEGGFKAYNQGGLELAAPKFDQLLESVEQGHNQNLSTSLGLFIDGLKQDALIAQSKGGNSIRLQKTRNNHLEQETVASQRSEQSKDLLVPLSVSYALMKISDGGPESVREGKLKLLEHQDHNPEIALDVRFQTARIRAFTKHFDSDQTADKSTEAIDSTSQRTSTDTNYSSVDYFNTKDIVSHFSSDELETIPLRENGKPDWNKITKTEVEPIDTFRNLLAMETGVEVKQKVDVPSAKREEIKDSLKSLFLDDYESPEEEEKAIKEELAKHDIPTLEQIAQEEIDELTRSVPEKDYGEATTPSLYDRTKYPVLTALVAYGGYRLLKQGGKFIFGKKTSADSGAGTDAKVEQSGSSKFYNELESPKERETRQPESGEKAAETRPTEEVKVRETETAVPKEYKDSPVFSKAIESGHITSEVIQNLKDKPAEVRDFIGYVAGNELSKSSVQELSKLSGAVLVELANPKNIENTKLYLGALETGMLDSSTVEKIFDAKMMEKVSVESDGQKGTTSGRQAIEKLLSSNLSQQSEPLSKGSITNLTSLSPQEVVSFVEKFGSQKVEAINKLASEPRVLRQTLESLQTLESNNSSREVQFRSTTGGLDTTIRSMVAEGKLSHEAIKAYDFALSRGQLTAQGLSDLLKQTKDVKLIETFNQSLIEQSKEVATQTRSQPGGAVLDPRSVRSSDFQSGQLEQGSRGDLNIARGRSGEVVQENRLELEKRSLETAIERERAKGNKEVVERLEALKKDMETNKEARERLRGMAREKGMSLEKLHSGGWLILASTAMTYLIFANLQEVEQRGGTSTISGTRRGG